MLEPKDLEMISSLFHQNLQPLIDVNNIVVKKVERLENDVAELKTDVATLKTEVADLKADVATLKTEVAELKADVATLKTEVATLKTEVADLKAEVATLKTEVADLKGNVATLKTEVEQLKTDVSDLQQNFSTLNQRVLNIELTLENETNKNIRIIAEGHLDLSRRFTEASKISEEDEMMKLRVTTLENEVRKIKTHLEIA